MFPLLLEQSYLKSMVSVIRLHERLSVLRVISFLSKQPSLIRHLFFLLRLNPIYFMPTKKSPSSPVAPKKTRAPKVSVEKKSVPSDLKQLRAEYFSLKMKHALRELKEVHKIRHARRAIARFLTKLHNAPSHEKN